MIYKCKFCGYNGKRSDFEIDHRIPISRNPFLPPITNIDLICSGCNRQKGNKTEFEYRFWRLINPFLANYGPIK